LYRFAWDKQKEQTKGLRSLLHITKKQRDSYYFFVFLTQSDTSKAIKRQRSMNKAIKEQRKAKAIKRIKVKNQRVSLFRNEDKTDLIFHEKGRFFIFHKKIIKIKECVVRKQINDTLYIFMDRKKKNYHLGIKR
jgi:hypothetical protein